MIDAIYVARRNQELERELTTLKNYIRADATATLMYLERNEPNLSAAIRKINSIIELVKE